jgi:hypothetical protein
MRFRLLPLLVLLSSSAAFAEDLPVPYQHLEYKQTGNVYEWKPLTKTGPGTGGVVFRGDTTISNAEPKISTQARLPYDKRPDSDIPGAHKVKVSSPITKANYGKALLLAGKIAWPIGVFLQAGEIFDYLTELGYQGIKNTPNGITAQIPIDGEQFTPDGYEYFDGSSYVNNPNSACNSIANNLPKGGGVQTYSHTFESLSGSAGSYSCRIKTIDTYQGVPRAPSYGNYPLSSRLTGCPIGHIRVAGGCVIKTTSMQDVTEQEIANKIAQESGWGNQHAKALQEALNVPGVTIETETPTVTGPSTTPGTTTTATRSTQVSEGTTTEVPPGTPGAQPATATTTTTTVTNNTYQGNKLTTTTTTNTTTNITNNTTNITNNTVQETKQTDETPKDEAPPTDTPLGPIPELYTRKYPDGIVGVWNDKKQSFKDSSVGQLVEQIIPSGMGDGGCPQWQLPLDIGIANYGTYDVSIPCDYWGYIRVIMIVASLFLARALIFGG